MKILGLSCSLRGRGNTETLLNEALTGAKQVCAGTELYYIVQGKEKKL